MINVTAANPTNQHKAARAVESLQELLQQALRRGFHGTLRIECTVQDGTIQFIRRSLEQMEK
jgi:hypothetical protein